MNTLMMQDVIKSFEIKRIIIKRKGISSQLEVAIIRQPALATVHSNCSQMHVQIIKNFL